MNKIIATVGILVFRRENKEVLLVKHGEKAGHLTDSYGLPAGRIEPSEIEVGAAKRELEEETGLRTSVLDLIELPYDFGVTELKRKDGVMFCTWKVFVCRKFTGDLKGSEETVPEWVKISELSKYWKIGNLESAINEGLKYLKNEN
jgi:8-oxo-dGTP pyrophosphatase MutT (NUDIX family)